MRSIKQGRAALALTAAVVVVGGCGSPQSADTPRDGEDVVSTASSSPTPSSVLHQVTVQHVCANSDELVCPKRRDMPPPVDVEVMVPPGWEQLEDFPNVITLARAHPTEGPDGAALLIGWTTFQVGVNSDPCLTPAEAERYEDGHESPDVLVGPTVDDFVDAVQAQKAFDVTEPVDTQVGGRPARFFSLEGPDDLSGCEFWRPWDPGIYAQGESNHWDVWVVDVGQRVVLLAQHFPETPPETLAQLEELVKSIRFTSS